MRCTCVMASISPAAAPSRRPAGRSPASAACAAIAQNLTHAVDVRKHTCQWVVGSTESLREVVLEHRFGQRCLSLDDLHGPVLGLPILHRPLGRPLLVDELIHLLIHRVTRQQVADMDLPRLSRPATARLLAPSCHAGRRDASKSASQSRSSRSASNPHHLTRRGLAESEPANLDPTAEAVAKDPVPRRIPREEDRQSSSSAALSHPRVGRTSGSPPPGSEQCDAIGVLRWRLPTAKPPRAT